MLRFDPSKLRTEKVYLSRVTGSYAYVRRNMDNTPYENDQGVESSHLGRPAIRVPFKEDFARDFIRRNYVREFSRAKRACMLWYGDTLIDVEIERGRKPASEGEWVSNIEASIHDLPQVLPEDREIFYDGQYIFWIDNPTESEVALDPLKRFSLSQCTCIDMGDMGTKRLSDDEKYQMMGLSSNEGAPSDNEHAPADSAPDEEKSERKAHLKTGLRSVLLFRPFAGKPNADELIAVSPVLQRSAITENTRRSGDRPAQDDRRALYRLGNPDNPVMGSLEFVMKAADVIGTHYGQEAVDFLDIPSIVAATGEVNLHRIDKDSRCAMPIQHRGEDCIAWLMGFIHREKDLAVQRSMTGMFRYVLRHGLVGQVDLNRLRKPENAHEEIPLKRFRGQRDKLAMPAPF